VLLRGKNLLTFVRPNWNRGTNVSLGKEHVGHSYLKQELSCRRRPAGLLPLWNYREMRQSAYLPSRLLFLWLLLFIIIRRLYTFVSYRPFFGRKPYPSASGKITPAVGSSVHCVKFAELSNVLLQKFTDLSERYDTPTPSFLSSFDLFLYFLPSSFIRNFLILFSSFPFKSYRQSVSPNCIYLNLKHIHLLFHIHDIFRLQRVIIKWTSNINIIGLSHNS
jgi:hypothetical protein